MSKALLDWIPSDDGCGQRQLAECGPRDDEVRLDRDVPDPQDALRVALDLLETNKSIGRGVGREAERPDAVTDYVEPLRGALLKPTVEIGDSGAVQLHMIRHSTYRGFLIAVSAIAARG